MTATETVSDKQLHQTAYAAMLIWAGYMGEEDHQNSYALEKIERVQNYLVSDAFSTSDRVMMIEQMFDPSNQALLQETLGQ